MSSTSLTHSSALSGSLSRSTTPEPQIVARLTNPRIPAAGGRVNFDPSEPSDLAASMSLSPDGLTNQENEIDDQNTHIKHPYLTNKGSISEIGISISHIGTPILWNGGKLSTVSTSIPRLLILLIH
ncbi:unnamed protein product [Lactuca saligna]|uniref:Uncharacterized protein n=1 Tax=Lactuca saligna TaxID=75948 RepID=A0AA35ZPW9_LACSI|nr:unnamed protein product [Lactuca saligna]